MTYKNVLSLYLYHISKHLICIDNIVLYQKLIIYTYIFFYFIYIPCILTAFFTSKLFFCQHEVHTCWHHPSSVVFSLPIQRKCCFRGLKICCSDRHRAETCHVINKLKTRKSASKLSKSPEDSHSKNRPTISNTKDKNGV